MLLRTRRSGVRIPQGAPKKEKPLCGFSFFLLARALRDRTPKGRKALRKRPGGSFSAFRRGGQRMRRRGREQLHNTAARGNHPTTETNRFYRQTKAVFSMISARGLCGIGERSCGRGTVSAPPHYLSDSFLLRKRYSSSSPRILSGISRATGHTAESAMRLVNSVMNAMSFPICSMESTSGVS